MKKHKTIDQKEIRSCRYKKGMITSVILIFMTIFGIRANTTYAQKGINLHLKGVTIGEIIDTLESRNEYNFIYKLNDVNTQCYIPEFNTKEDSLDAVLDQLFGSTSNCLHDKKQNRYSQKI